jgi:hypothetical protein
MTDNAGQIEVTLWEGELKAAPDRYAVPALTLPPLEHGTLVTYGEPGRWWVIDEAYTATPTHGRGQDEAYGLVLLAEEAGMSLRPDQGSQARLLPAFARDLWVYRDVDEDKDVTDIPAWTSTAFLDRLLEDDLTPPPIRRARPARELPSLTGRRLRAYGEGSWHWVVAVSEPLSTDGAILVKVVDLHGFGDLLVSRQLPEDEPGLVSLHRLWTY